MGCTNSRNTENSASQVTESALEQPAEAVIAQQPDDSELEAVVVVDNESRENRNTLEAGQNTDYAASPDKQKLNQKNGTRQIQRTNSYINVIEESEKAAKEARAKLAAENQRKLFEVRNKISKLEVPDQGEDVSKFHKSKSKEEIKESLLKIPERQIASSRDDAGNKLPMWKVAVEQEKLNEKWNREKKEVAEVNKFLELPDWKQEKLRNEGAVPKLLRPKSRSIKKRPSFKNPSPIKKGSSFKKTASVKKDSSIKSGASFKVGNKSPAKGKSPSRIAEKCSPSKSPGSKVQKSILITSPRQSSSKSPKKIAPIIVSPAKQVTAVRDPSAKYKEEIAYGSTLKLLSNSSANGTGSSPAKKEPTTRRKPKFDII